MSPNVSVLRYFNTHFFALFFILDQEDFHWTPNAKKPGLKSPRGSLAWKDKRGMEGGARRSMTDKFGNMQWKDKSGDQRLLTWWKHKDVPKIFNELYHGYQRSWTEDRPRRAFPKKVIKRKGKRVPRDLSMDPKRQREVTQAEDKMPEEGEEQKGGMGMNDMQMMQERSRIPPARGEIYSNIIYQRNGTCNALLKHVTCFGAPRWVHMHMGRFGKKKMQDVRMCSKPSKFVQVTAEFMCDNGAGYLAPVLVPAACEYQPCDVTYFVPSWSTDDSWDGDSQMVGSKEFWGNQPWWKRKNHGMNYNWFSLEGENADGVGKEMRWPGEKWERQICN